MSRVRLLKEAGARNVYAFATHGLFSGDAIEKISQSDLREVVVTNTVPLPPAEVERNERRQQRLQQRQRQQQRAAATQPGAADPGAENPAARALRSLKLRMNSEAGTGGSAGELNDAGTEVVITQLSVASVRYLAILPISFSLPFS